MNLFTLPVLNSAGKKSVKLQKLKAEKIEEQKVYS